MSDSSRDGELQYEEIVAEVKRRGHQRMGYMSSWAYLDDPKRLAFMLSRYKFIAKMVEGCSQVLEVGCGDGFGSRIIAQSVDSLTAIDFDPEFIEDARDVASDKYKIDFRQHDMLAGPVPGRFDAAYSLDVLEHIQPEDEDIFLANIASSLSENGICIMGSPSLESQTYASRLSKAGHVNCKTQQDLKSVMQRHYSNVFMFGMNDEVLHTGYDKMVHYRIALCCGPIR